MKTDRTPILLSAFVYPGAGQFLQRRWASAIVHSVLFTIFLAVFVVNVVRPIVANINAALAFAEGAKNESFATVSPLKLILSFAAALALYISSISDAVRATRRAQSPRPPPLPEV